MYIVDSLSIFVTVGVSLFFIMFIYIDHYVMFIYIVESLSTIIVAIYTHKRTG
jgi:hypothetical protein